jgi:rSAM/selenodomain-associated transferase 1
MTRPQLIIFAKAPVFGHAKTRLAKGVGVVHAKRLYRAMTRRILRNLKSARWDMILAYAPSKTPVRVTDWDGVPQIPQVSGTLSPRLDAVFASRGPVIVIGTDSPQIRRADILLALKAMKEKTVVFGPATDGGFWLIGLQGPAPAGLFDNIRWSHEQTLADMQRNCAALGYKVHHLRALTDIDDIDALRAYQRGGV